MGQILQNWRVLGATLFSVILVIGAYVLARNVEAPSIAQASTETALLQAIATKDSDSDGLPDWEEALYGTDPHATDTFHLGMTDGEAVAKGLIVPKAIADIQIATSTPAGNDSSLTSVFAKSFFALYLSAKQANGGADLTADEASALADQAMSQLSQNFAPTIDFKTASDIKVSGTGPDALRAFAIAAEAVLKKNKNDATMSDLEYLQSAVEGNDATATAHLASLAKAYRDSAAGLAVLPVPKELATIHLAIVNSIMRLSEIDTDFARVDTDPLAAILALQQFSRTDLAGAQAFTALADVYAAESVILSAGMPGAAYVNLIANAGRTTP
ncbi:MAG: thrombospondin type 3 repeat-containing protein [Candidatus Parcubacteria bacterium]|nr:thrombospondin type 3 repeat-containing protein [Candidatus Parcubacteria bacterium]